MIRSVDTAQEDAAFIFIANLFMESCESRDNEFLKLLPVFTSIEALVHYSSTFISSYFAVKVFHLNEFSKEKLSKVLKFIASGTNFKADKKVEL